MVAADLSFLPIPVQEALLEITDPEIPVLSIMDMGVVREVNLTNQHVHVKLTPTYSGCPAMDTMAADIKVALQKRGYEATVKLILAPAWTTDWITPEVEQPSKNMELRLR